MLQTKLSKNIEEKTEIAIKYLKSGYSCSEAVLLTYSSDFGLNKKLCFKLASGFGGGMALGETCGAVTGACMVIGLKYGSDSVTDSYSRKFTYERVARFAELFKKKNSSLYCRELTQGIDISDIKGRQEIREKGKVPQIVSNAIAILEKIFSENSKNTI